MSMTANGTPISPAEAQRWKRLGALSALCLLLGYLETFVPIPIPGVKLGLANIPVLAALSNRDLRGACWIATIKVLATGLLFGNPVTLSYSVVGTAMALVLMCPLSLLPTMRLEMVSVVGALAHEAGQLLVAQWLLGTPLVWYSAPLLAVAGCVTGLLCGVVARQTSGLLREVELAQTASRDLKPYGQAPADELDGQGEVAGGQDSETSASKAAASLMPTVIWLVAFVTFVVAVMHTDALSTLGICLAAALAAALLARVSPRALTRSLLPMLPIVMVTLIAQIASTQQGVQLATLGPVVITQGALVASAKMALRLAGITIASVALANAADRQEFARVARVVCKPIELIGCDLRGPELALVTTAQLLPSLAANLGKDLRPKDLFTRSFWTHRLPGIARDLYRQALQNS